jgi:quinol monooxygenase YgiN
MTVLRIKHKVRDYDSWKTVFDDFRETRKKGGEKSYRICHTENDPNELDVIFEWDNVENARSFVNSPELKNAMEKAGVVEDPEISFLKEVDQGTL